MRHHLIRGVVTAIIIVAAAGLGKEAAAQQASKKPDAPSPAAEVWSFHALAKDKLPAVVSVVATQKVATGPEMVPGRRLPPAMEDFLERFFGEQFPSPSPVPPNDPSGPSAAALGSGFIIDREGFVVTNNHVVENAESIRVVLMDETELPATVVGRDARTDLALLKVQADRDLPFLEWGNSEERALVGDWVLAIGNPFGLGGTVTAGIVSARARNIRVGPYDDFIQTDAAINRGNSGGPLIDVDGRVVGVNTAIFSPTGGNVGIGFAVPSSSAMPIVAELREKGSVTRGWLGVHIQGMTEELAQALGLDRPRGAAVVDVTEGGPADKAGIQPGDVILEFGGTKIDELRDLPRAVADAEIGSTVGTTIWRNGERITVEPQIARLEQEDTAAAGDRKPPSAESEPAGELGLVIGPLDTNSRSELGIPEDVQGALVMRVDPQSIAAREGVRPGDIISRVGSKPVKSPKDLAEAVRAAKQSDQRSIALLIRRDGRAQYVAIPLTDKPQRG